MANEKPRLKIAPSLLAADFARLGDEVARVEKAGCDLLHFDVMDGHFVPNLSVGPAALAAVRRITDLPLDAHLMVEEPWNYVRRFAEAGADQIIVHAEACGRARLRRTLDLIKKLGKRCGVSINPPSPVRLVEPVLDRVDTVLLMTVKPGFGGQSFMRSVLPKIRRVRRRFAGDIAVDGGVNPQTAKLAVAAGANVLVAGTAIFRQPNVEKAVRELRW
jgi:ribulose-phosphate 3-epimerase